MELNKINKYMLCAEKKGDGRKKRKREGGGGKAGRISDSNLAAVVRNGVLKIPSDRYGRRGIR